MPKRTDIKSILIIGAGPIVIGQACEFDYSGTQACKALKEEGYRIVLVNSNPATIMTDPELADATYIEPITPEFLAKIIEKERPDALLPTMGGQTALNAALSLDRAGVLKKFGVEMIGARAEVIDKAEDRELFREAMNKIGLETPRSRLADAASLKRADRQKYKDEVARIEASTSDPHERDRALAVFEADWARHEGARRRRYVEKGLIEALDAVQEIGLPAIIRPSFTLGGTGGGIAYNREEFLEIVERGLDASPTSEVLIEESVLGWKEYEMEVVRDKDDNCIIVCSIENIDPMGVHTGDSITVAPALTLTDKEYQIMRNASIAVLREIGVETGGSNVQFAVNPADGRLVIIEMNPRVSRSSALASKATGFPIAKIAAKLAVGYTLDELANDITGGATPASFEPTIDYVVTKIPRFAFEKFPGSTPTLTTSMKSVGEVMAIGRTFPESLQKALRSMETDLTGLDDIAFEGLGQGDDKNVVRAALGTPSPDRLLKVAQALRLGVELEQIYDSCKIDPWFIEQLQDIVDCEERVRQHGLPNDAANLRALKAMGFSDARLARLAGLEASEVAARRSALDVHPVYKRIDTCAAEFAAPTAYMYSTYEAPFAGPPQCEARPSAKEKIIILGGGPNRIGQGIEFDYCCCHAAFALSAAGYETIMINCNPETVSTDYDTSDRLYFEPLTEEDVLEIVRTEGKNGTVKGMIVQFGGQTPLKLAQALESAQVPILGTSPDAIDLAEDRDRFKALIERLGLRQPRSGIARSAEKAKAIAADLGFPLVIRPSYVLGGRAMEIVHDEAQLARYIAEAVVVSGKSPVLLDSYLRDAIEVDVDAIADGKDVFICGVMEHIEEAGVHSGDSACSLPPHSLKPEIIADMERQTVELGQSAQRGRPDERPVRHPERRDLHSGGQSPRLPHRAFRRQGDRAPGGRHCRGGHGRQDARLIRAEAAQARPYRGEGGGVPLRPLPRRRSGARARDALDRRGDGHRPRLCGGVRQEPARRRLEAPPFGHGVRLGEGQRQGQGGSADQGTRRDGLPHHRHARHQAPSRRPRYPMRTGQQGARGAPAHRRRHYQWRGRYRVQHHRGRQGACRLLLDPPVGLALPYPLLYNAGRRGRRDRGHQGAQDRQPQSRSPAKLCRPARRRVCLRRL